MTRRWWPRQLRTRVTLTATAVTLVVMAAAAFAIVAFQQRQLADAVDVTLRESLVQTSGELEVRSFRGDRDRGGGPGGGDHEDDELVRRVASSRRSLQLLDGETVRAASGALVGEPALLRGEALTAATNGENPLLTVRGDDERFRVAGAELSHGQVLVAAYSLADIDRSLAALRRTLLLAIPALCGLLGLLIWVVLGRALEPVEAIRREVAAITSKALGRRVSVPQQSVELARLATTMNDMLDRLDRSVTRQQRFVADAAHELRSPLAGMRGQLEVNLHHPDAPDREQSEREILVETIRLQELVDDLLLLARTDQAQLDLPAVAVDLDDLVLEEAAQLRRSSTLTVRLDRVSAAQVRGDALQLRRVIRNLVDNARRHAASTVTFELDERAEGVRLVVADDGPGIPAEHAAVVFDRFTRLEESRQRDAGGSGLGLAICQEIVERHGGSIELDTTATSGARFVVRLPLA